MRQDPKCYIGKKVSSLPPWIGPDHYQSDEFKPLQNRPDSSYQVSFRAESRQKVSVDELRLKKMAQTEISTAWLRSARKPVVPEYAQAVDCQRPHSAEIDPDCVSPFSRQSALSSLGHVAPASHLLSPTRVLLGDKSVTRSLSTSALHMSTPMDGNIGNTNIRLRPLKDKFTKASQPKWSVRDYTMGALQYQRVVDEAAHIQQFEVETQEFDMDNESVSTHHTHHSSPKSHHSHNNSNSKKEKHVPPGVPPSPYRPGGQGQGQEGQASSPGAPRERIRDDVSEVSHSASYRSHGSHGSHRSHRSHHSVHSLTPSSYSSVPVLRVTNINSALYNAEDIQRALIQKKEEEAMPRNPVGCKSPGGSWPKPPLFITTNVPHDEETVSTMTVGDLPADGDEEVLERGEGVLQRAHTRYLHLVGESRLESDVKPLLRRWARDSSLYTPSRPQHVKFLRAHKSDPPVGVGGLLLGDEAACGPERAHALMVDLGIDEGYFEALARSPINPKTAPSLHGDDAGDLGGGSSESLEENACVDEWASKGEGWGGPDWGSED